MKGTIGWFVVFLCLPAVALAAEAKDFAIVSVGLDEPAEDPGATVERSADLGEEQAPADETVPGDTVTTPTEPAPLPLPKPEPLPLPAPPEETGKCRKYAIVIAGGHRPQGFTGVIEDVVGSLGGFAMHKNAEQMFGWLTGLGFSTWFYSNGPDSIPVEHVNTKDELFSAFDNIMGLMKSDPPPPPGCFHELFIYISAHGEEGNFKLVPVDETLPEAVIDYRTVYGWLAGESCNGVKSTSGGLVKGRVIVTVLIDACYGGSAAGTSKSCKNNGLVPYFNGTLSPLLAGLTVMTGTDAAHESALYWVFESDPTDDFLCDWTPPNGQPDSIWERFKSMATQSGETDGNTPCAHSYITNDSDGMHYSRSQLFHMGAKPSNW